METTTISARVDKATLKKLEKLATATNRSKAYLTTAAIQAYVEQQTWQIEAIQDGVREANKGNFATKAEVARALKKWGVDAG